LLNSDSSDEQGRYRAATLQITTPSQLPTATPVPTPAVPSSPAQRENGLVRFFRALWEWLTGLFR
jgi:hypothetical protein